MDIGAYIKVGYRNWDSIFLSVKIIPEIYKIERFVYRQNWNNRTNKKHGLIELELLKIYNQFSTYLQTKADNMAKVVPKF